MNIRAMVLTVLTLVLVGLICYADAPRALVQAGGESAGQGRGTPFPAPAFNSGWIRAQYGNMIVKHNLGGNPDDYFISVDCKDSSGQIHDVDGVYTVGDNWFGMMWYGLNDSSITVSLSGASPAALFKAVRIRIWIIREK